MSMRVVVVCTRVEMRCVRSVNDAEAAHTMARIVGIIIIMLTRRISAAVALLPKAFDHGIPDVAELFGVALPR